MKFGPMLVLSLAAVLVTAPAVHAQHDDTPAGRQRALHDRIEEEANDPARPGPILGIGAVYALENFDGIGLATDDSGGYNAHIGYRFNGRVSTDLHVERYQEFDAPTGEVNGWAVGLNARGYILTGPVQPFVLLGMNYLDMETTNSASANPNKTDDGPALRFGTGVDWYVSRRIALTADVSYLLGLGEVEDYDVVAFSLGFIFRP